MPPRPWEATTTEFTGPTAPESPRPRVLHIITGLGTGGAESSLVRLLARSADTSTHAVVSLTTVGTRGAELAALGIPVFALGIARGAIAPSALGLLRKIAREFQPTCVQGWMYHGNLAASLLALSGARTGPVLWNVRHALDAWREEPRALRTLIRASAVLASQPRRIIYNSERAAEQHQRKGYTARSACVVPNGVNTDQFRPDGDARARVRAALGIPATAFVVGMIARVDPIKDHDTFLSAVAHHATDDRSTWYLLAGSQTAPSQRGAPAPLDARIRTLVGIHPELVSRLVRLGERRDISDILNACDVVTMTSRSEGSPNAVAEAMACGIPCVVTDVGDAARLVGDSGIVVEVGDAPAIAAAWRGLREDNRDRTNRGVRAAARIRAHYGASIETTRYRSLWEQASQPPAARSGAARTGRISPVPIPYPLTELLPDISPPRVLMVTTLSTTLNAFLLPFADRFRALGWRVDALASGAGRDPSLSSHFDAAHDISWSRRVVGVRNILAIRRVRALVEAGAYDIVHVHTPIAAFVTRFALRSRSRTRTRAKIVYTAHGFHAHPGGSRIGNALFRWIERVAARWTDYLVVMNQHDAALAQRDALVVEGHMAHHCGIGVDVEAFRPRTRAERDSVRAELGITAQQPVLAVVAEFNRNKRQRDVIAALARLRDEATDEMPLVLFIGDGPLRDAVARQARAACVDTHVRFLGQCQNVASLVGAADALVLASAREGLPRCVLEAMALGVPVIASAARGSTDLLDDQRGWLYPVGSVMLLAMRIAEVLRDGRESQRRAERAVAWVRSVASLSEVLAQNEAVYAAALAGVSVRDLTVTHPTRGSRTRGTKASAAA